MKKGGIEGKSFNTYSPKRLKILKSYFCALPSTHNTSPSIPRLYKAYSSPFGRDGSSTLFISLPARSNKATDPSCTIDWGSMKNSCLTIIVSFRPDEVWTW